MNSHLAIQNPKAQFIFIQIYLSTIKITNLSNFLSLILMNFNVLVSFHIPSRADAISDLVIKYVAFYLSLSYNRHFSVLGQVSFCMVRMLSTLTAYLIFQTVLLMGLGYVFFSSCKF